MAQVAVVDAGSFTLLHGATRVGREVFTIRRVPPPDGGFVVDGAGIYPAHRFVPILRTDTSGQPQRYQREDFVGERRQELLTVQVTRGRATERIQTSRGESAAEFVVVPGTRLLEDELFAQYYLVTRGAVGRSATAAVGRVKVVPVIMPGHPATASVTVAYVGEERIDLGGQSRAAVHLRIEPVAGDTREVWVDQVGRVLQVAVPARGLVAERDDPPAG